MFSTPQMPKRQGFVVKSPLMRPLSVEERCDDQIYKKRRLSSSESDDSFEQKSSLDLSFSGLNLNQSATTQVSNTFDSSLYIKVPTPIRAQSTKMKSAHEKDTHRQGKDCKSYIDGLMSSKNIQDITKCLQTKQEEKNTEQASDAQVPKAPPLFFFPFGMSMNLGELLAASCRAATPAKKYVGPLTKEERALKVQRYFEKKKNKQWKTIRYNVRKNLADQRERFQGRFVKNPNPKFKLGEALAASQRVTSGLVEENCQD